MLIDAQKDNAASALTFSEETGPPVGRPCRIGFVRLNSRSRTAWEFVPCACLLAVFFDPVTGAGIGMENLGRAMLPASRGCLPRFERIFLVPLRCVD